MVIVKQSINTERGFVTGPGHVRKIKNLKLSDIQFAEFDLGKQYQQKEYDKICEVLNQHKIGIYNHEQNQPDNNISITDKSSDIDNVCVET